METRGAASLRRSAIAERLRLREEWSALKGIDEEPTNINKPIAMKKKQHVTRSNKKLNSKELYKVKNWSSANKENSQNGVCTCEALRGVVVLVDVGSSSQALALRAALAALGATVVPTWSPIVTHLVWSQGGCRDLRAKARALACRVVSPLWVEACAAASRMLPETIFPAASRASDLPSPRTLKKLLKRAEQENLTFPNVLSDSEDSGAKRLRISSDTELDSTRTTDTSADTTRDRSGDKSVDDTTDSPDVYVRVNTAPRRALPASTSPEPPAKSRRKLFVNREPDDTVGETSEPDVTPPPKKKQMTQRERKELAKAERMARKLITTQAQTNKTRSPDKHRRFVLTGMSRTERQIITKAIRQLNGIIQSKVDRKTDTVLFGSCTPKCPDNLLSDVFTKKLNIDKENLKETTNLTSNTAQKKNKDISGICELNIRSDNQDSTQDNIVKTGCDSVARDEIENRLNPIRDEDNIETRTNMAGANGNNMATICTAAEYLDKPRTVNALLGAARGCRVLHTVWVLDSIRENRWLHHHGYEVKHLMKISQKARVERSALGLLKKEYAYNVFRGMRVRIKPDAEQKDAISQLLTLCGAVIVDERGARQDGGLTQYDGFQDGVDITIGVGEKDVRSKWVFDSVNIARMRTTRRYVNETCT